MNKTEKLLAARKKLKQFQQNKNHSPDNLTQQKDVTKNVPAKSSPRREESPSNTDFDSTNNPRELFGIDQETAKKCGAPEESRSVEKSFERENRLESNGNSDKIENPQTIHNPVQGSFNQALSSSSASPSPPQLIRYADHEINITPLSQTEQLAQMASAATDAPIEGPESFLTMPQRPNQEYMNEMVSSCVQEHKQLIKDLEVEVNQYKNRVFELEAMLSSKDRDFETKLESELNQLNSQLQVHAQTTEILVAEKAELTSAIEQYRSVAQKKIGEIEELNDCLKTSQARVSELEKELSHTKNIVDDTRKMYQQLHFDYAELDKRYNDLRKSKEDDELEASELRQELGLKNVENLRLQRELEEKNTLLSLNELKIQQLSNTSQDVQALDGQRQALAILEQQLAQSREDLATVTREKDEASKQYESYIRQLDSSYKNSLKELEESREKIEALKQREASYVQRLSDLEQSLQREKQTVEKLLPAQALDERIDHLTKSLDALSLEHANLQTTLNERDTEIEALKRDLEEARENTEDSVDKLKLVSALESEKLGASRAVSQNQQLKLQLNEMHDAFVTLSNSKLDLTEQLQAERTIGKKLNAQLNKVEDEVDALKEQLRLKTVALEELESEKLQTAQIADQMHHYQAQSQQARTLQQELQNSFGCIEILRRENQNLTSQMNALRELDAAGGMISDPLKKLEIRFKETMERVAELTEEKQRLEHLVLQLQGETETIGEYITLYQKQRSILQKKAEERETMFKQLVDQRNHQQEQLHQLKVLVAQLINGKPSNPIVENETASSSIIEFQNEHQEQPSPNPQITMSQNNPERTELVLKDKTTSKILDLLSEIKDCKDSCFVEPNFHPCPWCSGKLITV
ncbi:golgin subfamily A member 2 isoform X2 [Venturia canescens]|uniref:golgin subfamily A member 2 isoform X2 n=1 Tax=Venturia canescens TaxID=32260 RepID=UPI001C9C5268|nr:golgin subfamily A member 2 isoform X2 [Venturia canescens]